VLNDILPMSGHLVDNVLVNTIMTGRTTIKLEEGLTDNQRNCRLISSFYFG
jgi:hypothetical protein